MAAFEFERIKNRWEIDPVLFETKSGIYSLELMSTGLVYYVGKFMGIGWDYDLNCGYQVSDRIIKMNIPRNDQKYGEYNEKTIYVQRGHIWVLTEVLRLIENQEMYWAEIDTYYTKNVRNEFLTHWQRPDKDDVSKGVTRNDGGINWLKILLEFQELCNPTGGIRARLLEDCQGYSKKKIDRKESEYINTYAKIYAETTGDKISNFEHLIKENGKEDRVESRKINEQAREELYDILRQYKAFRNIKAPELYKSIYNN
jgi:hypothetical protein